MENTKESLLHWAKIFLRDMNYQLENEKTTVSISEQDTENLNGIIELLNDLK